MKKRYVRFELTLPRLAWDGGDTSLPRRAIICAVARVRGTTSLDVVEEHNGRIGRHGIRPQSIGKIGWMTQLAVTRVDVQNADSVTETQVAGTTGELCVGFFRRTEGTARGRALLDVTAQFSPRIALHTYTSLPYPVTVNASAEREGLKLDVVVDSDYCSPDSLQDALGSALHALATRRTSLFRFSFTTLHPGRASDAVCLFLPGNDGQIERLKPLHERLPIRATLVATHAVPDDLRASELESMLDRELEQLSGNVVAVVGWSFGAFLAHRLAKRLAVDAVLLDPPHADVTARRGTQQASVSEQAAELARRITKAFPKFEYEPRDRARSVRAFFSRDAGCGAFLAKSPQAVQACTVLSTADHESILQSPRVKAAILSLVSQEMA